MKIIVIPTEDKKGLKALVAEHFGRCQTYTFLDDKGKIIKTIDNTSEHMEGLDFPPELMKKHGAEILLCKDLGSRAYDLCKRLGIEVCIVGTGTVKDVFEMWKNNKYKKAEQEDVCQEHIR